MKEAFEELERVYSQVEEELKGEAWECHACGACCNFATNGMRLYIFRIERLYLQSKRGKNLCLIEGRCSGQRKNLCQIHAIRPLGCRTQFCTTALQEIYERAAKKIQEIEKKYGVQYEYSEAFDSEGR